MASLVECCCCCFYTRQRRNGNSGTLNFDNRLSLELPHDGSDNKLQHGDFELLPELDIYTQSTQHPVPTGPRRNFEALGYEVPLSMVEKKSTEEYYASMLPADYYELLDEVVGGREAEQILYFTPGRDEATVFSQLKQQGIKMIPNTDIRLLTEEQLGIGQFGDIYKGVWSGHSGFKQHVAVKMLRADATASDRLRLLLEVAIMAQFRHPNLVALYGISDRNVMIVTEFAANGDLHSHLALLIPSHAESISPNLSKLLLEFSQQICLGMEYLSQKGFVHRSLQARNILVSQHNVCKISNFSKSRDLADYQYYFSRGGKLPVPWLPPEAIEFNEYSTASDMWSYGCVLYEVWSLGHEPFLGMDNRKILKKVEEKFRLPPPPGCPQVVYMLMIQCWAPETKNRPKFRDVLLSLTAKEGRVLHIPEVDSATHSHAARLGAPLEAGNGMYWTLQNCYISPDSLSRI